MSIPLPIPEAVRWSDDGRAVDLLDQTRLPEAEVRIHLESVEESVEAIRSLRVRGAPAIGIAAALAAALEMERHVALSPAAFRAELDETVALLAASRPTAVNLQWALDRLRRAVATADRPVPELVAALRAEADAILAEDRAMCERIGERGYDVLRSEGGRVLTHCNAGALATGGIGTALAPIYWAHAMGERVEVWVGETRPLLQGSRITAWELRQAGVPVTLLADTAVGDVMRRKLVDMVLVGADRIAANGDVANKIGTYQLAVLASHHDVPFYVAAPRSTLDPETPDGEAIPIEERDADEVRRGFGRLTSPPDTPVHSPAFDVTPAELIAGIVTDVGVLRPPFSDAIRRALAGDSPGAAQSVAGPRRQRA